MGLWGAAQAIAFGAGGFLGTVLVDAAGWLLGDSPVAYGVVFGLEALGFFAAQLLAQRTPFTAEDAARPPLGQPRYAGQVTP